MLRDADKTRYFTIRPEEGQNPYIGFMSFQHFMDEVMYSDMVYFRNVILRKRSILNVTVPDNVKPGTYTIEVGIFDEVTPVIYFCTDAERNGSFYHVGEITIA